MFSDNLFLLLPAWVGVCWMNSGSLNGEEGPSWEGEEEVEEANEGGVSWGVLKELKEL